ncbi:methyltransferase domain-containing protein [Spirilliplanes yamanashiensis]|uniref:Methyltransferase n=1 Tax=Spirilliplanes yamanashiensis TaxID=42233 RepID=A0A8J4DMA2_9ACTN|nr:methyltransferase domain-containing protein [Spirilliplanes yamanashiensis]MDP9816428.1 thioredoxin reductase/SAM-dependent methyltransferase [Spirilliplanes yamanashiensis]GIJ05955.1 methyltransferase [Spirilliplanes yamanashiensis]
MDDSYDVVVAGGGAAGLSGALALARARRSVLVVDAGEPRNAPAGHVHNFLTRDGTPPAELLAIARAEVEGYGAHLVAGTVESAAPDGDGFVVTVDGRPVRARRLLVTTGVVDELPDLPGLREHWGSAVLHCPYCHGWEVRDRRIGVLATSPLAPHGVQLWRQWSEHVVLLQHTGGELSLDDREALAARGIPVVAGEVVSAETVDGAFAGVRLADGELVELDALVVQTTVRPRSPLLDALGLEPEDVLFGDHPVGAQIPAGPTHQTAVPGVYVAGNVADLRSQVITAAAAGLTAGSMINMDLIGEDTRLARQAYRAEVARMFEQDSWEERYGASARIWSGNPNPQLVTEAADLPPGAALDVGCGEGADAIWLAGHGWKVTAVDFSAVALARAAEHAGDAPIEWVQADLRRWEPPARAYQLVSAQFMHLPGDDRRALFARLAEAVAPGGTLLIVGHHPSDLRTSAHRMNFPDMMFTAEEVAAALDPGQWQVEAAETRPRDVTGHDGEPTTVHDAVLRARRS